MRRAPALVLPCVLAIALPSCALSGAPVQPPDFSKIQPSTKTRPDGSAETVLLSFATKTGNFPRAALMQDSSGAFYGTLSTNGAHNDGAVFKLTPAGSSYKEKILYSFRGGSDGSDPRGTLISDRKGALYGTTFYGGNSSCGGGCGTVFKLTPKGAVYSETILYAFAGGLDGANPAAGLLMDKSGALYGTTYDGGGGSACSAGCGTVYELIPKKSKYAESILNEFVSGTDGADPAGGLIVDKNGVLYGTTVYGGSTMCGGVGCGTVYKMTPNGNSYDESAVYAFQGGGDGQSPEPTLAHRLRRCALWYDARRWRVRRLRHLLQVGFLRVAIRCGESLFVPSRRRRRFTLGGPRSVAARCDRRGNPFRRIEEPRSDL